MWKSDHLNVNYATEEESPAARGKGKGKARTVKRKKPKGQVPNPEEQYNVGRLAWHKAVATFLAKWKINDIVDELIERYGRLPLQVMAARRSREVRLWLGFSGNRFQLIHLPRYPIIRC